LETLEGHRSAAAFTPSVGAVLQTLQCMLDIGHRFLSSRGAGLRQFALEHAVGIGQVAQLGDKRLMLAVPGGLGRRLARRETPGTGPTHEQPKVALMPSSKVLSLAVLTAVGCCHRK
jgi:hypothetical protein